MSSTGKAKLLREYEYLRIPESRMLLGLSPKPVWLAVSERLIAYQNFLTKKYHWIVKDSMMKLRTREVIADYLM